MAPVTRGGCSSVRNSFPACCSRLPAMHKGEYEESKLGCIIVRALCTKFQAGGLRPQVFNPARSSLHKFRQARVAPVGGLTPRCIGPLRRGLIHSLGPKYVSRFRGVFRKQSAPIRSPTVPMARQGAIPHGGHMGEVAFPSAKLPRETPT